ncbi:carboxylesterase [Mycobacterium sp. MS1601]|nr:carboxylesterase [Mycobacterium sp. MS1601]
MVFSFVSPPQAGAQPVITVETGALRGVVDDSVQSFKGIPFAAPPVGEFRWRAPQPAAAWSGVRAAVEYGNDCMQRPFPSDAAPLGATPAEDCLYLNVWRPLDGPQNLPVVVWIHGGGFVNGGASPAVYSGAELARRGVVVVSINYRLGRFGTFAHPQLTAAHEDGDLLGNYGTMDQIAALQWVQRNIAAFGGDPANVTVMGESAGGMSIHSLLTSPRARGLVDRAVIMSGGDATLPGATLADVEQVGVRFAESQGIAADDASALIRLRALSADQIRGDLDMGALFGSGEKDFASPFADGVTVVDPAPAYRSGAWDRVPVLVGATSADLGGRDGFMVAGARDVAGLLSGQAPTFYYRFSYVADSGDHETGAQHATDVPFFLHTEAVRYAAETTSRDERVGQDVSAYVVNFARSGDPNGSGLPLWPRFGDLMMDFTAEPVVQRDPWA